MKICCINNEDCTTKNSIIILKYLLCKKHYTRYKKWEDPFFTSNRKTYCCINDNCTKNSEIILRLCIKHYGRFIKWEDPFFTIPKIIKFCSVPNCGEKYFSNEFCRPHYEQIPEVKASKKAYRELPEVKAVTKIRNQLPEVKARNKVTRDSPKRKASKKSWNNSPEGKASIKKTNELPKTKERILKSNIKQLTKIGKLFNMKASKMRHALQAWGDLGKCNDNYECQICGSTENLISHHIFGKTRFPELSLNVNNAITLCVSPCHNEIHSKNIDFFKQDYRLEHSIEPFKTNQCELVTA